MTYHTRKFCRCGEISCPRTLGGLLVALLLLGGCGEASAPVGIGTRAVVIGIDGADWRVIEALVTRTWVLSDGLAEP